MVKYLVFKRVRETDKVDLSHFSSFNIILYYIQYYKDEFDIYNLGIKTSSVSTKANIFFKTLTLITNILLSQQLAYLYDTGLYKLKF